MIMNNTVLTVTRKEGIRKDVRDRESDRVIGERL
jgi:hypothetical protein